MVATVARPVLVSILFPDFRHPVMAYLGSSPYNNLPADTCPRLGIQNAVRITVPPKFSYASTSLEAGALLRRQRSAVQIAEKTNRILRQNISSVPRH
jgi:hypothetical protein